MQTKRSLLDPLCTLPPEASTAHDAFLSDGTKFFNGNRSIRPNEALIFGRHSVHGVEDSWWDDDEEHNTVTHMKRAQIRNVS